MLLLRAIRFQIPVLCLMGALVFLSGSPLNAQSVLTDERSRRDRSEVRVGLSFGGTGLVGLIGEYRRSGWAGELVVGTLTFREISVHLTGKAYLGDERFQPAVGAGIWAMRAWTEDGSGAILLARFPVAMDLRASGGHSLGLEVAMNRGLRVQRLDPEDDTPVNRTWVPLPGAYYRYGWNP